jgi:uncharacterized YccA/Bax inhibitor family protein
MPLKSGNPALSSKTFEGLAETDQRMTLPGTINRAAMLLAIVVIGAGWTWNVYFTSQRFEDVAPYLWGGALGGLALALLTAFWKQGAGYTSPVYALLEGFAIGALSALYEAKRPGIAIQAVGLTMGTFACMLAAYRFQIIKVTEKFRMGVVAATGGVVIVYLVDLVLGWFGHSVPMIHEGGALGIGFSLVVVAIAALNLVMDFDFIAQGVAMRSPKYMEWYCAFALIVTLVWLYLEILRLLGRRR